MTTTPNPDAYTPVEVDRKAMRAYLQRAEVRLSTMHRIGGAFLSGAGLLALLPIFARDVLVKVVQTFVGAFPVIESSTGGTGFWLPIYMLPVLVAFAVPLAAIWLLLKDLSVFYFTANIPIGRDAIPQSGVFHPRFALTAIPFSSDEAPIVKAEIRRRQFRSELKHFVLPYNTREKAWLTNLERSNEGRMIALSQESLPAELQTDDEDDRALRMAFGLAGAYDRDLTDEVAKSEMSVIRHDLLLRRLVMRYMKAFLILLMTMILSFVLVSLISGNDGQSHTRNLLAICIVYLIWSSAAPIVVRSPIRWIYAEYNQNITDQTRDRHLVFFEQCVVCACLASAVAATVGIIGIVGLGYLWAVSLGPFITIIVLLRCFGKAQWGFLVHL